MVMCRNFCFLPFWTSFLKLGQVLDYYFHQHRDGKIAFAQQQIAINLKSPRHIFNKTRKASIYCQLYFTLNHPFTSDSSYQPSRFLHPFK